MADILISKFTTQIPRVGATPATPGFAESEGQDPIAPSGTPQVYTPVTIGTPANGLSISGTQVLTIGLASTSATGALSSTDWNTFNGKIGGTIASGQVAFGTGINTLGGNDDFRWDDSVKRLGISASSFFGIINETSTDYLRVLRSISGVITLGVGAGGTGDPLGYQLFTRGSGATPVLTILDTGAIGFGTNSPTNTLDINGTLRIRSISSGSGNLLNYSATGVFTGSLIFDNTNSIGIGTSDPTFFSGRTLSIASPATTLRGIAFKRADTNANTATIYSEDGALLMESAVVDIAGFGGRIRMASGGLIGLNTTSPTNTLDVNGTARIRTINNLGTAATVLLTKSATGVISERNVAEARGDLGATTLGANLFTIPNPSAITFPRFNADNTVSALSASDFRTAIGAVPTTRTLTINGVAQDLSADRSWTISTVDTNKVSYNVADSKTASEKLQARVNIGSTSATPQIITTAGAINDLAVTSNHLVFTGASVVLSGIVSGLDGEEITILNASGTNLELLSQSALSIAANRFASGVIVPNLSIVRIKYRITTARWVLENVGINDGRYLRKDIEDTQTGGVTFVNSIATNGATKRAGSDTFRFGSNNDTTLGMQIQNSSGNAVMNFYGIRTDILTRDFRVGSPTSPLGSSGATFKGNQSGGQIIFRIQNSADNNILDITGQGNLIVPVRSNSNDRLTRRDELYLNYSETVATAGTLNDLAINASTKLLILTGATDLTGVVPVDNTRLLRIEARSASRIIRHESASSTAANRFSIGSDLTINAGEVYQFIYTDSRWRRVL